MATHRPRRMRPWPWSQPGSSRTTSFNGHSSAKAHAPNTGWMVWLDMGGVWFQWPLIGQGACAWPENRNVIRDFFGFNGHSSAKAHAPSRSAGSASSNFAVSMATHRPRRMRRCISRAVVVLRYSEFQWPLIGQGACAARHVRIPGPHEPGKFQWPLIGQGACAHALQGRRVQQEAPGFNGHSSAKAHAPPESRERLPVSTSSFNGHSSAKAHAPGPR